MARLILAFTWARGSGVAGAPPLVLAWPFDFALVVDVLLAALEVALAAVLALPAGELVEAGPEDPQAARRMVRATAVAAVMRRLTLDRIGAARPRRR